MMKKLKPVLFSFLAGSVFIACDKNEEYTYTPRKLFMPTGNIVVSYQPDQARLAWSEALHADPGKTAYDIEVAADSLFSKGAESSFKSDTTFVILKKGEIAKDAWYYARVRTISSSSAGIEPSNWLHGPAFRISDNNSYHNEGSDN